MGDSSSRLFQLRPVTFFYKPQYDDGSHLLQYGLIAEEVAKIYPEMVVYDKDGQPYYREVSIACPHAAERTTEAAHGSRRAAGRDQDPAGTDPNSGTTNRRLAAAPFEVGVAHREKIRMADVPTQASFAWAGPFYDLHAHGASSEWRINEC